jgi:uracil-DNA glycosylase
MARSTNPQASLPMDGLHGAATQLLRADPADWPVAPDWQPLVDAFFTSTEGLGLLKALEARIAAGESIFPVHPLRALHATPLHKVEIVLLGQDPYPTVGHADGLSFSAAKGRPKSLARVCEVLKNDAPGWNPPDHSRLDLWAKQGVLLLNTALTVSRGQAGSHLELGWRSLTQTILKTVAMERPNARFMLWGSKAQQFAAQAFSGLSDAHKPTGQRLLQTRHPSYDFDRQFMAGASQFVATSDRVDWWAWRA